jgi:hypothetical protein
VTGRRVAVDEDPWLEGPVGDFDVIGTEFFARFADREGLTMVTSGPPRGLVENFETLAGPACDPSRVDARVAQFYEQTPEYEFDVWSEWRGGFRPFGNALAAIFSRRLQQLNVPCVKVGFPLPNGSANVIMRPESAPDGSFTVRSSGRSFGDPGFYFFVESVQGQGWARYLKVLKEDIRVYVDPRGHLRADHYLQLWGATFLRLHYRIRRSVA